MADYAALIRPTGYGLISIEPSLNEPANPIFDDFSRQSIAVEQHKEVLSYLFDHGRDSRNWSVQRELNKGNCFIVVRGAPFEPPVWVGPSRNHTSSKFSPMEDEPKSSLLRLPSQCFGERETHGNRLGDAEHHDNGVKRSSGFYFSHGVVLQDASQKKLAPRIKSHKIKMLGQATTRNYQRFECSAPYLGSAGFIGKVAGI